ncbi:hypothetical protein N2K95_09640 [Arthrobacter zhaoxinii]|uniref:Antitoxin VbhA domain-containing protein n=1 Tax=Arthrobacter zhaoxinii TaxID=2964616 RepID=A0ABY5YMF3_9MICC|nr:hypothetical protein [Arthrobacter zhaoxinii]UWX95960.1 hypothetical protein N2K95_09640 [Arthrobacter zhaoxinii]
MVENLMDVLARLAAAPRPDPVPVGPGMDVVSMWPGLFEGLTEERKNSIRQTCASSWHAGWEPNREDVADLVAHARGEIDMDEFMRRADERAHQLVRRAEEQ